MVQVLLLVVIVLHWRRVRLLLLLLSQPVQPSMCEQLVHGEGRSLQKVSFLLDLSAAPCSSLRCRRLVHCGTCRGGALPSYSLAC